MAKIYLYWHSAHSTHLITWMTRAEAEERRETIATEKPEEERALRLALFKPVKAPLPARIQKARAALMKAYAAWAKADAAWMKADAAWMKAYAAWVKADAAWDKDYAAWKKAMDDYMPALIKLHAKECHPNCPWDGNTIFAKGTGIEVLEG